MWEDIKKSYTAANRLCGDIVKVTPSSKVVGDLAQFMVSNNLTEEEVISQADSLSFPVSVIEYFQGYLGEPPFGYLEPFRTQLLEHRKLEKVQGRPGKSMPPLDFESLQIDLEEKWGKAVSGRSITDYDVLSAALYPKVFEDFMRSVQEYGGSLPSHHRS